MSATAQTRWTAFGFAAMASACMVACMAADSVRLLAPFVASIGVIWSAPGSEQRRRAGSTAFRAHLLCALIGGAMHAALAPATMPLRSALGLVATLVAFLLLRRLGQAHAPALALLFVLASGGASGAEFGAALAMATALATGSRLLRRGPPIAA